MRKIFQLAQLLLAVVLLFSATVQASPRSPYTTDLRIGQVDHVSLSSGAEQITSSAKRKLRLIAPLRAAMRVPSLGNIELVFTHQRIKTWQASITDGSGVRTDRTVPILLRGAIVRSAGSSRLTPVAASIIDGVLKISIIRPNTRSLKRIVTVSRPLSSSALARVQSVPESLVKRRSCKTVWPSIVKPALQSLPPSARAAETMTVELATDTDSAFYSKYGTSTNAEIAAIVDGIDTIYQRDLGLQLSIIKQNTFASSSPYTGTTMDSFLEEFRNYTQTNGHLGSFDVAHCFGAGTRFSDSDAAGLAYLGVMCSFPEYSYGVMRDVSQGRGVNTIVVAHEIGHNLGTDHDASGSGFIMAPVVSASASEFSSASKNAIAAHIASDSSCLTTSVGDPIDTPLPTYSVSIGGSGKIGGCSLRATVTDSEGLRAAGVNVSFAKRQRNGSYASVKTKTSNSAGIARYFVSRSGVYRASIDGETTNSESIRCRISSR